MLEPVAPAVLPVASGNSAAKREMNSANDELTSLTAQIRGDTLYDPPPPPPQSPSKIVSQGFCDYGGPGIIAVGVLLVIFAFLKRN